MFYWADDIIQAYAEISSSHVAKCWELLLLPDAENQNIPLNSVYTMATYALAPCVARTSAATLLAMRDKLIFVFHGVGCQPPTILSQRPESWYDKHCKYSLIFHSIHSAWHVLIQFPLKWWHKDLEGLKHLPNWCPISPHRDLHGGQHMLTQP